MSNFIALLFCILVSILIITFSIGVIVYFIYWLIDIVKDIRKGRRFIDRILN